MQTALAKGWYVVVPDYEGVQVWSYYTRLYSCYFEFSEFSVIRPDAKAAVYGYSGGTIASEWAAFLQPKYVPELKNNPICCAIGGWVTNITLTAEATDGAKSAGLLPIAVNGLINEYPILSGFLRRSSISNGWKNSQVFDTNPDVPVEQETVGDYTVQEEIEVDADSKSEDSSDLASFQEEIEGSTASEASFEPESTTERVIDE
ncbi:uncharacterized protein CXQ87_001215 [Candidozyma duobushaemuli]|uniref:Triacylglycerol lipase n=1 Tax=Candidozyma duobushaemuli TaxID=1231522 RepID=A0A2V1AKK5_9ASCO|nr:uncharacterized protein CXQ87_001215 [[Candida] duobushaemulonis]PVH18295.1 hypothetical protein CXQ87_001215 [[Candida] duobushaemulonis]